MLLYCARSWIVNNWLGLLLAGVVTRPLACPPFTDETFPYDRLCKVKAAYIALHGEVDQPGVLFGDERAPATGDYRRIPALSARRIREGGRLKGLVVFLEGCNGMRTEFPEAFLSQGAAAVVGSVSETFDMTLTLGPAGVFGREFVRGLRRGMTVAGALVMAQARSGVLTYQLAGKPDAKAQV